LKSMEIDLKFYSGFKQYFQCIMCQRKIKALDLIPFMENSEKSTLKILAFSSFQKIQCQKVKESKIVEFRVVLKRGRLHFWGRLQRQLIQV